MFKNYEKNYSKFCEYLQTELAQLNVSEMDDGFSSMETLIAYIYDKNMPCIYNVKILEETNTITLFDSSIDEANAVKDTKLNSLSEYMSMEFSFVDSTKKMQHCVYFGSNAYLLTDYGIVSFFTAMRTENIKKITSIKAFIDNELHKQEIEDFIKENLVTIPISNRQRNISVCTQGSYGVRKTDIALKPFDCDIKKNYNDDIPYDKLNELVNSEKEELILLHGEPGTGKTSIIKKLIYDNEKIDFLYFDFNLLTSFSDSKIFDFLMENKNHVLIIEDCEKLFTDRNNGNQYLNTMLNLTDGIIGEAFGIKFICTFNCPVNKIDKAVMREGRLSLIYEFKKLSLEKTKDLLPTATQPMTLAEIYNTEGNGNKNKTQKIGF